MGLPSIFKREGEGNLTMMGIIPEGFIIVKLFNRLGQQIGHKTVTSREGLKALLLDWAETLCDGDKIQIEGDL